MKAQVCAGLRNIGRGDPGSGGNLSSSGSSLVLFFGFWDWDLVWILGCYWGDWDWIGWYGYWFVFGTFHGARSATPASRRRRRSGRRALLEKARAIVRAPERPPGSGPGASGGEARHRGDGLSGKLPARSYARLRRGPGGNSPGIAFAGALTREGRCAAARPTRPAPWGAVAQGGGK